MNFQMLSVDVIQWPVAVHTPEKCRDKGSETTYIFNYYYIQFRLGFSFPFTLFFFSSPRTYLSEDDEDDDYDDDDVVAVRREANI